MSRDEANTAWSPGRWWQVLGPDGTVWAETSVEHEARERMRPGDTLWRLWQRRDEEWRQVE